MNIKSSTLTNIFLIGIFVMMAYLVFSNRDITINNNSDLDSSIAVDGKAETFVKPDTASVSFSITKKAQSTDVAMKSVNERMSSLVKGLTALGIDKKDIKTTGYNVYPQYSYKDSKQHFEGYRVTQTISVIIRDLKKASDVLALVNNAGVDDVSGLNFYVDDTDGIKEKLRAQAIANAKQKAEKLEKELGVKFVGIIGYDEYGSDDNIYPAARGYMAADAEMAPTPKPEVPTGQNQFSTNVSVIYRIK